jgi:uncharacterized repeat protein (TIGR03943 family)
MAEVRPRRFGIPQAMHTLILLLPLAYLWNAQGVSLDAYAFQNRSLGLPSIEMQAGDSASSNNLLPRIETEARETTNAPLSAERTTNNERAEPERITRSDPSLPQPTADPRPAPQAEKRTEPPAIPPDPDDLVATTGQPEEQVSRRNGSPTSLPDPGPVEQTTQKANRPRNPERVQQPPILRPAGEGEAMKETQQDGDVKSAAASKAVTIIDLYYAPRAYEGKRVKLIGMLHKNDAQVKKDFGRHLLVVFRFVINCCAADATPAAVLVDGTDFPDLPESSWVEVEGTFKLQEKNGRRVPILEKSSIRKTDKPKQPYLF